jgi:ABC-type uncharacterized transport system involved in gliding motility auxiliary subunit
MREAERLNESLIICNEEKDKMELAYRDLVVDYNKLADQTKTLLEICQKTFDLIQNEAELVYFDGVPDLILELGKVVTIGKIK